MRLLHGVIATIVALVAVACGSSQSIPSTPAPSTPLPSSLVQGQVFGNCGDARSDATCDEQPVSGVKLDFVNAEGEVVGTAQSDSSGHFSILLEPGSYGIRSDLSGTVTVTPVDEADGVALPGTITVEPGTTEPVEVRVTLGRGELQSTPLSGTRLIGRVTLFPACPIVEPGKDCDEQPLPGATIVVTDAAGREVARVQADGNGRFLLDLDSGTYQLVPQDVEGILSPPSPVAFTIDPSAPGPIELDLAYDSGMR